MNNGFVMYPTNKKQLKLLKIKDKLEDSSIQKHEPTDDLCDNIMFQSSDVETGNNHVQSFTFGPMNTQERANKRMQFKT